MGRAERTGLGAARLVAGFRGINAHGAVTVVSGIAAGAGVALYLWALVSIFNLGIELQMLQKGIAREEREVAQSELELREREADFTRRYADILEGMERISAVKYLAPENVALGR